MSLRVSQSHVVILGGDTGQLRVGGVYALLLSERNRFRDCASQIGIGHAASATVDRPVLAQSYLPLGQSSQSVTQGSEFERALAILGFNDNTQDEAAFVHALLQYAAKHHVRRTTIEADNPISAALNLLEADNLNPHAMKCIRRVLTEHILAHDRRPR